MIQDKWASSSSMTLLCFHVTPVFLNMLDVYGELDLLQTSDG